MKSDKPDIAVSKSAVTGKSGLSVRDGGVETSAGKNFNEDGMTRD